MEMLTHILLLVGAGLIIWFTWSSIKNNPRIFSSENINKSIFTLGILALILIGVIGVLVMILRQ